MFSSSNQECQFVMPYHLVDKQVYGKTIATNCGMDTKFVAKVGRHPKKFVKLLRGASKEQVQSLVDATVKVLRKEIPVSSRLRNAIIEQRRFLRHLSHPHIQYIARRGI